MDGLGAIIRGIPKIVQAVTHTLLFFRQKFLDKCPKSDYNRYCPISDKLKSSIVMKALSTRLFALNEAWKENANIYRQMAKQMNLTDMAMWALYTLRVEPGEMTQSRMCEFLHEPKQTINSALKKMEADGLITLQSGSNRRTKTIHLTAAGEALARETADRVAETEQQALAQFSEEEANQLFSLMRRLNALLTDIFPQTVRNQEEENQAK